MEMSYCRLCAGLKSANKLINLQNDELRRNKIFEKLTKVNVSIQLDDDLLPKTVCLVCVNSLERTVEFIVAVEQAQTSLKGILKQNVKEEQINEYDNKLSINVEFDVEGVKLESKDIGDPWPDDYSNSSDIDWKPVKDVMKHKEKTQKKIARLIKKIPKSIVSSWHELKWMCAYCDTQFPTANNLISHSMKEHGCCNPFKCSECNTRKVKFNGFITHVKAHCHKLKSICHICYSEFPSKLETEEHIFTHHNHPEHTCVGCNTNFLSKDELESHTSNFQRHTGLRSLTCEYCKETFQKKSILVAHVRTTHRVKEKLYTCEKCGKSFMHQSSLCSHYLTHSTRRPYQCKVCKMTFKTVTQLRAHVLVHNPIKPFVCDQCGRGFRLKKQLKSHSIIHSDSLPYTCSYCNKGFRFKTIHDQHLRQHTGAKPYSCDHCQRNFRNWPNYHKHMKRKHGVEIAKKKITPDGVYPIDPKTGEIIKFPETEETIEWKERMKIPLKPGQGILFRNSDVTMQELKSS